MLLCSINSGLPAMIFLLLIFISFFSGSLLAAEVTLHSLQIHKTHQWLKKPTIYFYCQGENKTVLPDVKEAKVLYTFQEEESWQPLTEFTSKKCKRCGFYEKDLVTHEVFDEWEFCPSDFSASNGTYTLIKEGQLNATFSCTACVDKGAEPRIAPPDDGKKGMSIAIVILISATVTVIVIIGFIGGYKYWQKRKRQREQARFLKLFEEQDDMEDELGLGDDI